MTGAYFRVKRHGKYESIELEHLTPDERANLLKDRGTDYLLSCIDILSDKVRESEQIFKQLVDDGVLEESCKETLQD